MIRIGLIVFFIINFGYSIRGCGISWTLPQAHFEGVDEHGYVAYWEKLADISLGDGLTIPVNMGFDSHREANSPTLGKGWILPILESHVEPVDENTLNVIMPDGWTFEFLRNGNTETWRGNGGWVGQTRNTIFSITAPCGWRIKFDEGKIQSIETNTGQLLSYQYNGPIATEVDLAGKALMQVKCDAASPNEKELTVDNQKILISWDKRPAAVAKGTQNFITGLDQSLHRLEWANGKVENFSFGTDELLNPTLAITRKDNAGQTFKWSADTRRILNDGTWTYVLTSPTESTDSEFTRTNSSGGKEYYYNNSSLGTTIVQGTDGIKHITSRFVNAGYLSGKIRSLTEENGGIEKLIRRFDYDERGKLIRERQENGEIITYQYDNASSLVSAVSVLNGKVAWQRRLVNGVIETAQQSSKGEQLVLYHCSDWERDPSLLGALTRVRTSLMKSAVSLQQNSRNGIVVERLLLDEKRRPIAKEDIGSDQLWEYIGSPGLQSTFLNGVKCEEDVVDDGGHALERRQYDKGSGALSQVQQFFYDEKRRAAKIITLDPNGKTKDIMRMTYDEQDRVTEQSSVLGGTYKYFYSILGERQQVYTPPSPQAATVSTN